MEKPDLMSSAGEGAGSPGGASWAPVLAELPRQILQPFSLSAVALVSGVFLGVFVSLWASIAAFATAVLLLVIGLRGTPRDAVGVLVGGSAYQPVAHISTTTHVDTAGLPVRGGRLSALESICFLHLYQREGGSVGRSRTFRVDYFVDLMTAALIPSHLECLTRELAEHVRRTGRLRGVTTVASPKRGNALLVTAVARELSLEPLFVKERPLFGKTLEGIGGRPKHAVIVDDISSDGELLVSCVSVLRQEGYEVAQAYVVIDRPEGDAILALGSVGVRLMPLCSLSDLDLESIAARGRSGMP